VAKKQEFRSYMNSGGAKHESERINPNKLTSKTAQGLEFWCPDYRHIDCYGLSKKEQSFKTWGIDDDEFT
jgi:hypothetical protein